jgi:type II secretory ATPase GspE/PulE/Tfp pilus assembly ATPase PilB-like protein
MAKFYLKSTNGIAGDVSLASGPIAIGRHPDNDIVLKDDLASRFHCVIEPAPGKGYRVRDLGSRNGTRVNEEAVEEALLKPGDVIHVGGAEFHFQMDSSIAERRAAARAKVEETGNEVVGLAWAAELRELIEELPPKGPADNNVVLIDASGRKSGALAGAGPGPEAVRLLLLVASKSRATDIHLEPRGEEVHARIRVDGQMVSIAELPPKVGQFVIGLIRTACELKTAGRDAMLDGHYSSEIDGNRVDYRASFTPSVHGQKLVLRVLDLRNTPTSLDALGLAPYMLSRLRQVCQQDAGMVLVCGPTGSGKTTTLYNAMREIDREHRNVVTIEDPVEYHLEGVTQIPAEEGKGNSFNSLLRSVLRQDPDVILVGEVRDEETARTAMRAAMTGHLVFSTVHAKDTIGAIFRLLDLGVEPYLVANSLDLVVAQRLIRVLCDRCKQPTRITPAQATKMGRFTEGTKQLYTPVGCSQCLRTGYRGRSALLEMLDFNDDLRDVILTKPSINGIKKVIEQGLFTTLQQSGWQLAARGATSLEEVERVVGT